MGSTCSKKSDSLDRIRWPDELSTVVESAVRYSRLRRELARIRPAIDDASDQLPVSTSPAMRGLRAALDQLASHDVSILIEQAAPRSYAARPAVADDR
jgi:DNA-binding NtrC family response regulator